MQRPVIPASATGTFVLTVGIEPTTAPLHPRSSAVCVPPDPQDGARETYPSPEAVVYDRSIFPVPAQGSTSMTDNSDGEGHLLNFTAMNNDTRNSFRTLVNDGTTFASLSSDLDQRINNAETIRRNANEEATH